MSEPSSDPSIEHEPHLAGHAFDLHPTAPAQEAGCEAAPAEIQHNVWEEPALSMDLAGGPSHPRQTYAGWLDDKIAATSYLSSLGVMIGLAFCAGPWGVLGALFGGGGGGVLSSAGLVAVTIFGPVTEEIAKVALALWVVEQRPYLFKSIWQILVFAAAGGAMFGVIENLVYLHVYIPNASPQLADWRWSVCTGLHVNCSFVMGVGLARVWDTAIRTRTRPYLGHGMGWFATAIIGHGLYNLGVSVAEYAGWLDF